MLKLFSDLAVPALLAGIALYASFGGVDVYGALTEGAGKGLHVLRHIFPALTVLLTAAAMFQASGAVELAEEALAPILNWLGLPPELLGLMLVRPVSGSAALGVGAELIGRYGPDSLPGRTAAVMLGSTETTFYTAALYFGTVGISRTRYTVPAALCADAVGFLAAAWAVRLYFGA